MAKDILIIGSQHGNETLGIRLFEYIKNFRPELLKSVDHYCANPLAFAQNIRFIDTDMNRSYHQNLDGYEATRANQLLSHIRQQNYKYILGIHTTTTEVGGCLIIGERSEATDTIINAAPNLKNIIIIKKDIAKTSLLSASSSIVAVEFNHALSEKIETLDTLTDVLENLASTKKQQPVARDFYKVVDYITANEIAKDEPPANFIQHADGKYPVLSGGDLQNRTYSGFWTEKLPAEYI